MISFVTLSSIPGQNLKRSLGPMYYRHSPFDIPVLLAISAGPYRKSCFNITKLVDL